MILGGMIAQQCADWRHDEIKSSLAYQDERCKKGCPAGGTKGLEMDLVAAKPQKIQESFGENKGNGGYKTSAIKCAQSKERDRETLSIGGQGKA